VLMKIFIGAHTKGRCQIRAPVNNTFNEIEAGYERSSRYRCYVYVDECVVNRSRIPSTCLLMKIMQCLNGSWNGERILAG